MKVKAKNEAVLMWGVKQPAFDEKCQTDVVLKSELFYIFKRY